MARMADEIADYMRALGLKSIGWGDDALVNACRNDRHKHALDAMQAGLAAMERAPDLFEKRRILAHDRNGNPRVVRNFRLREAEALEQARTEKAHE